MKKRFSYIFVFFILLTTPLTVLGKSLSAGLEISDKTVANGDTVEVKIKVKDKVQEDMNVFKTVISFDESLFEGIDEESFKTYNGWYDCTYNKETHALILINKFGSSLNEDIVTFNLKVKDKIKPKSTSITLKNASVANKNEEISINDITTKINLSVPSGELGDIVQGEEYYGKTLEGSTVRLYNILVVIILELIIATVLVMLFYASKLYVKNSNHRKFIVVGLCIVEIFAIAAMFGYDVNRGELAGDDNLDFKDLQILREHLVNLKMISPLKLANADMNKDGKLSSQDLAILLDKTMEKSQYSVILTDSLMESNGYEKGSIIDLRFTADITDDLNIDYVLIDGKKYKASKVNGSSKEYTVKLEASSESKKYNYNLTEVILESGKSVKVDYKTEVMVLKDIPKLTGFATNYNKEESKVNIALTLEDNDNAIVNAKYELIKSNGQVVKSGVIEKGKNSFTFELENAKSYKFKIKANYNRGAESGEYLGFINDSYDLKIITDYKLQLSSLTLVQNDREVTNLQKGVETTLTFYSTNVSGYVPRKAMINGSLYNVVSIGGNKFSVKVPNDVIRSTSSLSLSKIILSNGKVLLTNAKVSYNLLKDVPVVTELSGIEDIVNAKMALNVSVKDDDRALSKLSARLYDADNELLSECAIGDDNYNVMLDTIKDTEKYFVRIYADYSTLDGNADYHYSDVLLYEKEINAIQKVNVKDIVADKIYPEKNEVIKLRYTITSNYNNNVSKIVVNNVIYDAKKSDIDTYEIEIVPFEESGIKDLKTSKIIYENGFEYNLEKTVSIDVLKDIPVVDNFEVIEDKQESKIDVSFDLFDKDNAFVSGKLKLVEKDTGEVKREEDVILGKNASTFVLENAIKYDVQIVINAVLDTKTLNNDSPNILENYEIKKVEARLITDYKLDITVIETFKNGSTTQSDVFNKGEKIDVEFTSTNVTEYVPIKVKIADKSYDVETIDGISKFTFDGFDETGLQNIKFESIILSNHVELIVNSGKKVEVLKNVPVVDGLSIDEEESSLKVRFELVDTDKVITNLKAVILGADSQEIFNGVISTEERLFSFDKGENRRFTIKILADYNLRDIESEENEFKYNGAVLFEKEIDLDDNYISIENVDDVVLVYEITDEEVSNVTFKDLENLKLYKVKVQFLDSSSIVYELEKIRRIEDTIAFVLKNENWIKYSQGKWSNKLVFEYGRVDANGIIEKSSI